MYLSRTNSLPDILLFLVLTIIWSLGGWLLVTHAFHLHRSERIPGGLAAGFLLFISFSNLLAHILPLTPAFWGASILVLLVGAFCAWRSKLRPVLETHDLSTVPALVALAALTLLFVLILKGESIFDEYLHLPLISSMAAGSIPPRFYLNPDFYFAYHYGIHVFAANLVRLAGLFPWSAWDISRALAIAFTLVLGWLWVHKVTRSTAAAWLGSLIFTFGGGTRWLLLLLPGRWLDWVSQSVNLVGTGLDTAPTLGLALTRSWVIEGGGPVPFPFAFHNGIFVPAFFALGSTGAMAFMTILLLLLLLPRGRFSTTGLIAWSLIFSTLALSAEHLFVVSWAGIAAAIIISILYRKRLDKSNHGGSYNQWAGILAIALLLALVQGGFITETVRNMLASVAGGATQSINARGFSLRWPPGLLSAHLGSLSIVNPGQLVALLAELGPAVLLVIFIFTRLKKWISQGKWFTAGLALSAGASLVFPLFFQYEVDRSITRMPATGLWTALVLSFPILWMLTSRLGSLARAGLAAGYVVVILAGGVIFFTQLYSIPNVEYTYFIDDLDASYSADYWDRLPQDSQVLDSMQERSVTIFGRIPRASSGIYDPLPEWLALISDPNPTQIASAGYDYVYMSREWWDELSSAQQANFQAACIDVIDERKAASGADYRLLVDVSACR